MPELTTAIERTPRGSVIWPVPERLLSGLPEVVECHGLQLQRKADFHLTVLGHRDAAACFDVGDGALFARWQQVWPTLDRRIDLLDELWLLRMRLEAGFALSLAVACSAPAIAAARRLLSEWARIALPEAPPHITLFWHGDARGIPVPDAKTLRERVIERHAWDSFGLRRPAASR